MSASRITPEEAADLRDAVRAVLGLPPMLGEHRETDTERFAAVYEGYAGDGGKRTPNRGAPE
jgi:hypothetical protein